MRMYDKSRLSESGPKLIFCPICLEGERTPSKPCFHQSCRHSSPPKSKIMGRPSSGVPLINNLFDGLDEKKCMRVKPSCIKIRRD